MLRSFDPAVGARRPRCARSVLRRSPVASTMSSPSSRRPALVCSTRSGPGWREGRRRRAGRPPTGRWRRHLPGVRGADDRRASRSSRRRSPGAPPGFFEAEARGLDRLRVAGGPPVPQVRAVGADGLVLDWVEPGAPSASAAQAFGRSLAALHRSGGIRVRCRARVGFVATVALDNTPAADWPTFAAERRLGPALQLASDRGAIGAGRPTGGRGGHRHSRRAGRSERATGPPARRPVGGQPALGGGPAGLAGRRGGVLRRSPRDRPGDARVVRGTAAPATSSRPTTRCSRALPAGRLAWRCTRSIRCSFMRCCSGRLRAPDGRAGTRRDRRQGEVMPAVQIPARLREASADGSRDDWLAQLPSVVAAAQDHWALTVGAPYEPGGHCAWVAPARQDTGAEVVLKIGWPHPESDHEAAGLLFWAGAGDDPADRHGHDRDPDGTLARAVPSRDHARGVRRPGAVRPRRRRAAPAPWPGACTRPPLPVVAADV